MKEIHIGLVGAGWMGKAHSSALLDAQMLFGPTALLLLKS